MAKVLTEAAEIVGVPIVVVVVLVTTYCFFFRCAKLCGMHCCCHRSKVVRVADGRRGAVAPIITIIITTTTLRQKCQKHFIDFMRRLRLVVVGVVVGVGCCCNNFQIFICHRAWRT